MMRTLNVALLTLLLLVTNAFAQKTTLTKSQAIWNVSSASGGYRLVAKGADGKASVVYLLSLDFPEIQ